MKDFDLSREPVVAHQKFSDGSRKGDMYRRTTSRIVGAHYAQLRPLSFSLPKITNLDAVRTTQEDFKGLWSSNTINELWYKRGQELVNGLNASLENSNVSDSNTSNLLSLISQTIHQPELFGVYAYATLLYNLQFGLESLRESDRKFSLSSVQDLLKTPTAKFENKPNDDKLKNWLIDSFGSIEEFRTLLLNSAKSIKGDGYVWLVAESNVSESILKNSVNFSDPTSAKSPVYNNLSIINTYNVGIVDDSIRSGQVNRLHLQKTAKVAALKLKQQNSAIAKSLDKDSAENSAPIVTEEESKILKEIEEFDNEISNLTLGTVEEAELNYLFNDRKLLPVLAIDASQRNYLLDYGVFGKQQYLDNLWECIDWEVVISRLPERTKKFVH